MHKKYIILLFLVLALVPLTMLFYRESMIGIDSYGFINAICGRDSYPANFERLSFVIFANLPCDFAVLKTFSWVIYLFLLAIIALLGHHFFGKMGLIAPLFAFMSSYWLVFPWEFENDMLAMPFLWFCYYLLVKERKVEAMLLAGFVGLTIWGGAWFFLILIGLSYFPSMVIGLIVIWLNKDAILGNFLPNVIVAENMLFGGLVSLMLLSIGWLGWVVNRKTDKLLKQAVFLIPVAFLSGKYAYHAVPLLCLGMVGLMDKFKRFRLQILIAAFVMFVVISWGMTITFPKAGVLESVQDSIELARDLNKPLLNDWDVGYYVEFEGYDTNYKGGIPNPDYNTVRNAVLLTIFDLNYPLVKDYGFYKIYDVN